MVSFTIRRPTPLSREDSGADSDSSSFKVPSLPRHLANPINSGAGSPLARSATSSPKYHHPDSSDDDDDDAQDELVTGFDQFGVQRLHEKKKPQGPLVIPPLQNRDWRELARKRKAAASYVPPSAKATTGADGSVGGLGTKDSINSGPQLVGLQMKKKVKVEEEMEDVVTEQEQTVKVEMETEESEDQKALRAILAGTDGSAPSGPVIDIIPQPISETDALRQDVEELPHEATLDDYARVPVAQFGAALLRGMGWKEGTAASRRNKGPVEPYLPTARPALLGIGAKEREILDDGSKQRKGGKRPERRYVPVVKREKSASESRSVNGTGEGHGSGSGGSSRRESRRSSRSPSRRHQDEGRSERDYDDRGRERRERRDYEYERDRDGRRDRDYGDRDRDRDRERRSESSSLRRKDKDRRD